MAALGLSLGLPFARPAAVAASAYGPIAAIEALFAGSELGDYGYTGTDGAGLYTDAGITPVASDGDLIQRWVGVKGYLNLDTAGASLDPPYNAANNSVAGVPLAHKELHGTLGTPWAAGSDWTIVTNLLFTATTAEHRGQVGWQVRNAADSAFAQIHITSHDYLDKIQSGNSTAYLDLGPSHDLARRTIACAYDSASQLYSLYNNGAAGKQYDANIHSLSNVEVGIFKLRGYGEAGVTAHRKGWLVINRKLSESELDAVHAALQAV